MKINPNKREDGCENLEPIYKNAMSLCIITSIALTYLSGIGAYYLYQEGYLKTCALVSLGVVMGFCISSSFFCYLCRPPLYK